jgi:hypothetical protein
VAGRGDGGQREDDEPLRQLTERILTTRGYTVIPVQAV